MLFEFIVGNAVAIVALSMIAAAQDGRGPGAGALGCGLFVLALLLVWLETILVAYLGRSFILIWLAIVYLLVAVASAAIANPQRHRQSAGNRLISIMTVALLWPFVLAYMLFLICMFGGLPDNLTDYSDDDDAWEPW